MRPEDGIKQYRIRNLLFRDGHSRVEPVQNSWRTKSSQADVLPAGIRTRQKKKKKKKKKILLKGYSCFFGGTNEDSSGKHTRCFKSVWSDTREYYTAQTCLHWPRLLGPRCSEIVRVHSTLNFYTILINIPFLSSSSTLVILLHVSSAMKKARKLEKYISFKRKLVASLMLGNEKVHSVY